jgi:hypothetical protein
MKLHLPNCSFFPINDEIFLRLSTLRNEIQGFSEEDAISITKPQHLQLTRHIHNTEFLTFEKLAHTCTIYQQKLLRVSMLFEPLCDALIAYIAKKHADYDSVKLILDEVKKIEAVSSAIYVSCLDHPAVDNLIFYKKAAKETFTKLLDKLDQLEEIYSYTQKIEAAFSSTAVRTGP